MTSLRQPWTWIFGNTHRPATAALALTLALTVIPAHTAYAQQWTLHVLHNFTDGTDGALPLAGLTIDRGGNLYGSANVGGSIGAGTVYNLKRSGSNFSFNLLYSFNGSEDGAGPQARVIFGPNGSLYGTTTGGGPDGHGVVFNLRPPPTACRTVICPWSEAMIYRFTGGADGNQPETGDVAFDAAGNLYGTTAHGGDSSGDGVAYKLTPSHGTWTESDLFEFAGSGSVPYSGMSSDGHGNWFGTTTAGGAGFGTVYELTPAGSGWMEQPIYTFLNGNDGRFPTGGLIIDQSGDLYGTTSTGGHNGAGTVFKLTFAHGTWNIDVLFSFAGSAGPSGSLTMDAAGNLYGITAQNDPHIFGEVFQLTPSGTYNDLYDFQAGNDGAFPQGGVVMDSSGNLYGTAELGGANGKGTVWELEP
jgi:uncharacterized repeat protein (TIGR03803 family)